MPLGAGYGLANQLFVAGPSGLLWVSDGGGTGFGDQHGLPGDTRMTLIRVFDTNIPTLITTVDVSAYAAPSPYGTTVRMLRMTHDGNHVLACLHTFPQPATGLPAPWAPGKVLFINKSTYAVEGVALLNNISGFEPGDGVQGARDCLDSQDGYLWVINGWGGNTSNSLERFDIAAVLANGPGTPTTSVQRFTNTHHSEELCFGDGYIWTNGGAYTQTVTRIDPTNGAMSTYTYTQPVRDHFFFGPTFLFGALWSGDESGTNIYRFDPAHFGSSDVTAPGFLTDTLAADFEVENGFVSDGTYLWAMDSFSSATAGNTQTLHWYKINPTSGSVSILSIVSQVMPRTSFNDGAESNGTFDGTNLWWPRHYQTGPNESGFCKFSPTANSGNGGVLVPVISRADGSTGTGGEGGGLFQGCRSILFVPS